MSVFGDIVKESKYIDDKVYVSFDEENYRRLELKLKMQEQEIERLNKELEKYKYTADELNEIERLHSIIKEVRSIYQSLCFSAPENNYVFIEQLGEILDKENK